MEDQNLSVVKVSAHMSRSMLVCLIMCLKLNRAVFSDPSIFVQKDHVTAYFNV